MAEPGTDPLSPLAFDIRRAVPGAYQKLVVRGGTPAESAQLLGGVEPAQLLAVPVESTVHASALLAGLWLWHDALEECHRIVQKSPQELAGSGASFRRTASSVSLNTGTPPEGGSAGSAPNPQEMAATLAWWHAIMHRREGDFSNSKYWFARCRNHVVFPSLAIQSGAILNPLPAQKAYLQLTLGGWNPDVFVDLVEAVWDRPDDPRHRVAVSLQQLEWRVLFDHCTRAAAGQ